MRGVLSAETAGRLRAYVVEELEALLARHGVGDARAPRFVYYDDDNNKRIDKEDFLSLLLGERGC